MYDYGGGDLDKMNAEQELLTEDIEPQKEEPIMPENGNDKPTPPVPPAPAPTPNGGNDKMPYDGRTDISDLLTWRGVGGPGVLGFGYGGGYGGGGGGGGSLYQGNNVLAALSHADGTAIGSDILANRALNSQGLDRLSEGFEATFRSMQFNSLSKEHTDLERRVNEQNAAVIATLNDVSRESAKCCCEAKLQAETNKCEILTAIAAESKDTVVRELGLARDRINQLEIIDAVGDKHGRG